ncbi:MAG: group II truncated hemoglobin [Nitrospiraceae bacterium]|jgi:hemoglobin|nr:group II truncated hemoglobin [Nitrospiraceae bacterium]OQW67406.1 MAG: globin [Nitrospira sp. ST-bin5]
MTDNAQDNRVDLTPYQAAGQLEGLTKLVDEFYATMDTLPEARTIRNMHPKDLAESRKKLTYFLSGWLGGPKLFQQHYGPINIPGAHKQFPIGHEERDAWLLCMQRALAVQPYSTELKDYLLAALSIPAERIRQVNAREI